MWLRVIARVLVVSLVASCGAPLEGSVMSNVTLVSPIGFSVEASAKPPLQGWVNELQAFGVEPVGEGRLDQRVVQGTLVATISYASEETPFELVVARKGAAARRRPAPWTCVASPAELERSGDNLWVHCLDPSVGGDEMINAFWHSADAGSSWTRAGRVPMGYQMYAIAGDTLFGVGWDKSKDSLTVTKFSRSGGEWVFVTTPLGASKRPAGHGGVQAVVASLDGKDVAVIASAHDAFPGSHIWTSRDGAATFKGPQALAMPTTADIVTPSLVGGTLRFVLDYREEPGPPLARAVLRDDGAVALKLVDMPTRTRLRCGWGENVVASRGASFLLSSDFGASFRVIAPPIDGATDPDASSYASCEETGFRLYDFFHAWPPR